MRMKRGKVLLKGVFSFAIVVAVALTVLSSNIDGTEGGMPIYGSDSEPFGGMYLEWSELDGGETFYLAKGSPVEIHCPGHELNGFWQFLEGSGLEAYPGEYRISGTLDDSISTTIDGKTIFLKAVETSYGDLPVYGDKTWNYSETYTANVQESFEGVYHPGLGANPESNTMIKNYESSITIEPSAPWLAAVIGSYTKEIDDGYGGTTTGTYREYKISGTPTELGQYVITFKEEWDVKSGTLGHVEHITVLTVQVVCPSTTYKITFDTDGKGTCDISSIYLPQGKTYYFPNVVCNSSAYVFKGWYISTSSETKIGGVGDPYPNASLSIVEDTTFYAQYEIPSNRVESINLSTSNISVRVGTNTTLTAVTELLNDQPFDADKRHISFSPEQSAYAGLSLMHTTTGGEITIVGTSIGSFTLTITSLSNPSVQATCTITVIENAATPTYNYSIWYVMDGGTPTPPFSSFTSDSSTYSLTFYGTKPVKYGYDFLGWSIGSKGEPYYDCGVTTTINYGNTEIYANWTECKYTYTVSLYDNQGLAKLFEDVTVLSSDEYVYVTIDDKPAKPGYTFSGWASSKGSDTIVCYPGGSYRVTSSDPSKSLYAVFEAETEKVKFTLSFDNNNGTNGPGMLSEDAAATSYVFTVPSLEPVRTGWTFMGWSDLPGGEPKYRYNGTGGLLSEVTVYKGGKIIYACWKEVNRTLEFNLMGGSGTVPTQIATESAGYYVKIPDVLPVKTGYIFAGWSFDPNTSPTDLENLHSVNESIQLKESCFMYAIWSSNSSGTEYTLSFDIGEDATGAPEPITLKATLDDDGNVVVPTFTIPDDLPKADGRYCVGWSLSENATVPTYYKGDTYKPLVKNTTLHAVWSIGDDTWEVNFFINGTATESFLSKYAVITNGVWEILLPNPDHIDGLIFVGWSSDKNASYDDNPSPGGGMYRSTTKVLNLYGIWKEGEIVRAKIIFDANGGDGEVPIEIGLISFGEITQFIPAEPTPTKEGYIFIGWTVDKAGNEKVWPSGSYFEGTVQQGEELILHAQYEKIVSGETIQFHIEYYYPDKTFIGRDTSDSNAGMAAFPLWGNDKITVPEGYTFDGWSLSVNGEAVETNEGYYSSHVKTTILYAIFTPLDPNLPFVGWKITMNGLTVHFDASSCRNVVNYNWTLQDGTKYSGKVFDYTFPASGKYLIKLECTGIDGKVYDKTDTIEVKTGFDAVKYVILVALAIVFIVAALRIKGVF